MKRLIAYPAVVAGIALCASGAFAQDMKKVAIGSFGPLGVSAQVNATWASACMHIGPLGVSGAYNVHTHDTMTGLGRSLFGDYLFAVELAGTILLVATIGAIAIAPRRSRGTL